MSRVFAAGRYECNGVYCRGCDECESTGRAPEDTRSREQQRDDRIAAILAAQERDDEERRDLRALRGEKP